MRAGIKTKIAEELGIDAALIPDDAICFSAGSIVVMVDVGLGRSVALYCRSSTSYRIR
jgi:hypothetical protein